MRLQTYINEGRSEEIDLFHAMKYVKEHCQKSTTSTRIYRGNKGLTEEYYLVEPSKSKARTSPFSNYNYYNLLLSNLPSWKKYPKRNKSLVCTTESRNARQRGNGVYYIVLPVDSANIGVCPADDIWDSFNDSLGIDMDSFNDSIDQLFRDNHISRADSNYNDFVDACDDIDLLNDTSKLKVYDNYNMDWIDDFTDGKRSFLSYVNHVLNPERNKFSLIKAGDRIPSDVEVWTDAPCILIRNDVGLDSLGL